MTRLFIPPLGSELVLAKDWTFTLHNEHRNETLAAHMGKAFPRDAKGFYDPKSTLTVTLPAGAKLCVERIYIRKGQDNFNSVTFTIRDAHVSMPKWRGTMRRVVRFWAKLADANQIEFEENNDAG